MPQAPKSLLSWIRQLSGYLLVPTVFFLMLMASDRWRHVFGRLRDPAAAAEPTGPPLAKLSGDQSAIGRDDSPSASPPTSAPGAAPPATVPAAPAQPASLATPRLGSGSADEFVQQAIDKSEQVSALTAKVRCVGNLFKVNLELEGRYWQLNRGGRTQVRYELTRKVPGTTSSSPSRVLQISDGRFLWEISEQGTKRSVGRTDLRQLQEHPWSDKLAALRLGTGGLPKLLTSFQRDLDWKHVDASELDGIPVWQLTGTWKKHRAAMVSQGQPEQIDKWPPHIPDSIQLMLGKDDLIPYRIDFRRGSGSLMVCELFEVATPAVLDEDLFRWLNAEPQIEDRTESLRSSIEATQKP